MREMATGRKKGWLGAVIAGAAMTALVLGALWITGGFLVPNQQKASALSPGGGSVQTTLSQPLALPEEMRGVWLRTGEDIPADFVAACPAVDSALDAAVGYGMNTLFVPVATGQGVILASGQAFSYQCGEGDLFSYIVTAAHQHGLAVCAVVDLCATGPSPCNPMLSQDMAKMAQLAREVAAYGVEALLLDHCIYPDGVGSYEEYMRCGGSQGYEAFRRDSMSGAIRALAAAAKETRPTLPVGALSGPVWANASEQPNGFDTAAATGVQSAFSFGADTLGWAKRGLIDFLVVDSGQAEEGAKPDFAALTAWWRDALTGCGIKVAYNLSVEKVSLHPDTLIKQVKTAEGAGAMGCAFDSLSALIQDTSGFTSALMQYYQGNLDESSLQKELTLTSPSKLNFTTYEASVALIGGSDENFPLYLNGKEVARSGGGYFSVQHPLEFGNNTLILTHKGKTVTLQIEYKMLVLKAVSPTGSFSVDGGTAFLVSAIARRDAVVKATFHGKTIRLKKSDANVDEANTNFATYSGMFTVPAGKDAPQNLGSIRFTATFQSCSESKTGSTVTVNARLKPGQEVMLGDFNFDKSLTLGKWGYVTEIKSDQAETFDGDRLDDRSRPTNSYLPMGTIDYCSEGESVVVQNESLAKYRLLDYGKRVYTYTKNSGGVKEDYTNLYYRQLPTTNTLSVAELTSNDRHTTLTLNTMWKAPFEVTLGPQAYRDPYPAEGAPDYSVTSTTYEYMDIRFAYSVSGQGAIDLTNDPVFSSAQWRKNADGTYTLRLTLRKKGQFYGWGCNYNQKGQLVFSFLHPVSIAKADNAFGVSLKGVLVALDAGHGGANPGATAKLGKTTYYEDEMNFALSKQVQSKLEQLGATVVQIRDGDYDLPLYERTKKVRKLQPDLFLSLHRNSSVSSAPHGFESYYYQPYSRYLANRLCERVSTAFRANRGERYITPMFVTRISDCPSVLAEFGYLSNAGDLTAMAASGFDDKMAEEVVKGIVDYLISIQ